VALVAARERLVVDSAQKPYRRAYAWWKNLQVWSSLRFSDHVGLRLSTLRMSEGVLRGSLLETKTTGRDKKHGSRAFVVSSECYLVDESWLATGLQLWQEFGAPEDYFLSMPTADLLTTVPLPVDYLAASAMSRALHRELLNPLDDLDQLLLPEATGFWREHSGRHCMPSWVAATQDVPEEWISHLGGWAVGGSAVRYIATVERRIMNMQEKIGRHLREQKGGSDDIDESGLLFALGKHLEKFEISEVKSKESLDKVNWFKEMTELDKLDFRMFEDNDSGDADDDGFGEATGVIDISDDQAVLAEVTDLSLPRLREDMRRSLPSEYMGEYAISLGAKSKNRCLHLLGACHRVPGLHYADYELYDERPDGDRYHNHCKQCWKTGDDQKDASESESSSSSGEE
jgi:hypothetical protein